MEKNKLKYDLKKYLSLIRILIIAIVLFSVFKLLIFFLPFLIALFISNLLEKVSKSIANKYNISLKIVNNLIITIFYVLIISLILLVIFKLYSEIYTLSKLVDKNSIDINKYIELFKLKYEYYINKIPIYYRQDVLNMVANFLNSISEFSFEIVNYMFNLVLKIPTILFYVLVTIFSTYLISNEKDRIKLFIEKQFPEKWLDKKKKIKENVINTTFDYFKSQAIIVFLCFIELWIGYFLIDRFVHELKYVTLLALLSALMDAMPLIGTGPLLQPWMLYLFLMGDYKFSLAILIQYIVVSIFRMAIEPYILTGNLKLHPIMTIVAMFVGYIFFGVFGFFVGPMIFTIIMIIFEEEIEIGFFKIISGEKK